jgi:hypothetical protein
LAVEYRWITESRIVIAIIQILAKKHKQKLDILAGELTVFKMQLKLYWCVFSVKSIDC